MSLPAPSTQRQPFNNQNQYLENITLKHLSLEDKRTSEKRQIVQVYGTRIALLPFMEKHWDAMIKTFGENHFIDYVKTPDEEFTHLREVFGQKNLTYLSGKGEDREKTQKRLNRDAERAAIGNLFTGYAIVSLDPQQGNKIIGRMSMGSGYVDGQSQSGLILHPEFRGQRLALEAITLAGVLAQYLYTNEVKVKPEHVNPVQEFSFTNVQDIPKEQELGQKQLKYEQFMTKLGFESKKLPEEWNYSDKRPRLLWTLSADRVMRALEEHLLFKSFKEQVLITTRNVCIENRENGQNYTMYVVDEAAS